MFENIQPATIIVTYVAVLFALSVHEAAHASMAYLLDDDTAQRMGRMTLNPLAHIDLLGTVILPLMGMITGFRVLGWAKPVPVNPSRLTRRFTARTGYAMVAAAGPISNLLQSLVFLIILCVLIRVAVPIPPQYVRLAGEYRLGVLSVAIGAPVEQLLHAQVLGTGAVLALSLLGRLIIINIGLAIFNLLPFGPLDGAGILRGFLPYNMLATFDRIQPTITIVLLVLFMVGGRFMSLLLSPFFWVAQNLYLEPLARLLLGA